MCLWFDVLVPYRLLSKQVGKGYEREVCLGVQKMAERPRGLKLNLYSDSDDEEYAPTLQCTTDNMDDVVNDSVLLKYWGAGNMNNEELQRFFGKLSGSSTKTKAVQTQPDSSGVPPSWIVTGQNMANELYVGINNLLNSTFHPPLQNLQRVTKTADEAGGSSGGQKKPLPEESVRPKSTLHPVLQRQPGVSRSRKICNADVGMPSVTRWDPGAFFLDAKLLSAGMGQSSFPNFEELRRELLKLRDTSEKLRTLTLYLKEDWNSLELETNAARTPKIVRNKYQQTEPEMAVRKSVSQRTKYTEYDALSDISEEYSDLESMANKDGDDPVHGKGSVKKPSRDSMKSQKPASSKVTFRTGNVKCIPGVYVSRYKIPSRKDSPKGGQKSLVDVRKDRSVEIEESSIQPKATASSSGSKNFIKKNILALRTPANRTRSKKIDPDKVSTSKATTSKATTSSSPSNSDSSVTSSQTKNKWFSDL